MKPSILFGVMWFKSTNLDKKTGQLCVWFQTNTVAGAPFIKVTVGSIYLRLPRLGTLCLVTYARQPLPQVALVKCEGHEAHCDGRWRHMGHTGRRLGFLHPAPHIRGVQDPAREEIGLSSPPNLRHTELDVDDAVCINPHTAPQPHSPAACKNRQTYCHINR